jgi:hypothetical protein
MPSAFDYFKVIVVSIYFFTTYAQHSATVQSASLKKNWPKYRCNPLFMPFADNVEENFYSCMQTSMKNFIPYFLDPLHTLLQKLTSIADSHSTAMNSMRISHSNTRSLFTNNFQGLISAFESIGVEFMKNILNIKDLVAKIVGIVMTIVYIIESAIDTMGATWNGPPGQMLQGIQKDFCFHPETLITLQNGQQTFIKCLQRGDVLHDGSIVLEKMSFYNLANLPFFDLQDIKVTQNHKVFSEKLQKFVCVKDHEDAIIDLSVQSEWLVCLITSSNRIVIKPYIFYDWNDDDCN